MSRTFTRILQARARLLGRETTPRPPGDHGGGMRAAPGARHRPSVVVFAEPPSDAIGGGHRLIVNDHLLAVAVTLHPVILSSSEYFDCRV